MAMHPGRPRRAGERYPGGKIKPRDEGDVRAPTLWRRIKDGAVKGGADDVAFDVAFAVSGLGVDGAAKGAAQGLRGGVENSVRRSTTSDQGLDALIRSAHDGLIRDSTSSKVHVGANEERVRPRSCIRSRRFTFDRLFPSA